MINSNLLLSILRNKRKSMVLSLYTMATLFVCAIAYQHYAALNAPMEVRLARASAAAIYFNSALIFLPMLRFFLSNNMVRKITGILPLHYAIEAHIIIAYTLTFFSLVHVLAYLALYGGNGQTWLANIKSRPANSTGIALTFLLFLLVCGAYSRKSKKFEYFYYSHYLFIPFVSLCFWHAPKFAYWTCLPFFLYLSDRFIRFFWMTKSATVAKIDHVRDDTHITLTRPEFFSYQAGDYAFLCVPSISRLEWHPFSLVNAPANRGDLTFTVRRCGTWTQSLTKLKVGSQIRIDGPFASPSRELLECSHSIIIASGIGITPFISFFNDLLDKPTGFHQKIVLYWLERDARNFAEFHSLLLKLHEQLFDVLELNLIAGKDSNDAMLNQPFIYQRKIDWNDEFKALAALNEKNSPATVFFCGNRIMSSHLRSATKPYGFKFRTESF
ncbi:ferric reductase-like transmembrane domain-containing protein [Burkholderia sp. YIM B11467]